MPKPRGQRQRDPAVKLVPLRIVLPRDVFDQVYERAEEMERSLSNMVTRLLRRALEMEEEDDA